MKPKTSALSIIFPVLLAFNMEYVEGTDSNGVDVYGYMEIDDVNAPDGFVETSDGDIIFLDDETKTDAEKDYFEQIPEYEDCTDAFGQQNEMEVIAE